MFRLPAFLTCQRKCRTAKAVTCYMWWLQPATAHKFVKIPSKLSNTSYMFRPLMWLSSGRCVTKNTYTEMLQNLVNQCTCAVLNIKITRFKISINFKMGVKVSVIHSRTQQTVSQHSTYGTIQAADCWCYCIGQPHWNGTGPLWLGLGVRPPLSSQYQGPFLGGKTAGTSSRPFVGNNCWS
jgi:hypothetical protein